MDEQIELPAEDLAGLTDDAGDVVVRADVALGDERRVDAARQLADAGLDALALVGEGEPGTRVGETLRDRPPDRALVGDPEDQAALAVETRHGGRVYGFSGSLSRLRRIALLPLGAALLFASSATATFQPVRRTSGELTLPRVRAGTLKVAPASSRGRVTVLVDLRLPPLAVSGANVFDLNDGARLNVRSAGSRAYLARLASAQRAAAAQLKRAIPSARSSYRYRVILDGVALSLPARKLPAPARLPAAAKSSASA